MADQKRSKYSFDEVEARLDAIKFDQGERKFLAGDGSYKDLPTEYFLDQAKTTLVQSFVWSAAAYPGTTDPGFNGKPVMVFAVKGDDGTVAYSFLNMELLVSSGGIISNSGIKNIELIDRADFEAMPQPRDTSIVYLVRG